MYRLFFYFLNFNEIHIMSENETETQTQTISGEENTLYSIAYDYISNSHYSDEPGYVQIAKALTHNFNRKFKVRVIPKENIIFFVNPCLPAIDNDTLELFNFSPNLVLSICAITESKFYRTSIKSYEVRKHNLRSTSEQYGFKRYIIDSDSTLLFESQTVKPATNFLFEELQKQLETKNYTKSQSFSLYSQGIVTTLKKALEMDVFDDQTKSDRIKLMAQALLLYFQPDTICKIGIDPCPFIMLKDPVVNYIETKTDKKMQVQTHEIRVIAFRRRAVYNAIHIEYGNFDEIHEEYGDYMDPEYAAKSMFDDFIENATDYLKNMTVVIRPAARR